MNRIRPVRSDDLDPLLALAGQAGFGLTTLPPERELLERRIHQSLQAFQQILGEPAGQSYLFVLEDTGTEKLLGTSGIVSKAGGFEPFYAYRIESEIHQSKSLEIRREVRTLHLVAEHSGPGEIGSLFLDRNSRKKGLGGLLSRSRFLFMAEHPDFFESSIVAELRGVVDDTGRSPFWDAVGTHFFGIDFPRADYLSIRNKQFIAELMPRHPIYLPLLPREAQDIVGRVHPRTEPALKMLEKEGFRFGGLVDIFEAGPVVACERKAIRTVWKSKRVSVAEVGPVEEDGGTSRCLIGNTRVDFRACSAPVREVAAGKLRLDPETAAALEVEAGDSVRYVSKT